MNGPNQPPEVPPGGAAGQAGPPGGDPPPAPPGAPVPPFPQWFRVAIGLAIVGLGVYVALSPGTIYSPVPRVVLFLLISILPAILFGSEAASRFTMDLKVFAFTTGGAFAVVMGCLVLLDHLSRPAYAVSIYQVVDRGGEPVSLEHDGAVTIGAGSGLPAFSHYVSGNSIIVVFPEQLPPLTLTIRHPPRPPSRKTYSGAIHYTDAKATLVLGKDLLPPP